MTNMGAVCSLVTTSAAGMGCVVPGRSNSSAGSDSGLPVVARRSWFEGEAGALDPRSSTLLTSYAFLRSVRIGTTCRARARIC